MLFRSSQGRSVGALKSGMAPVVKRADKKHQNDKRHDEFDIQKPDIYEFCVFFTLDSRSNEAQEREDLEARLGAVRRLKRLSGTRTEEELLAWCRDASESLEWLEASYAQLEETT